MKEEKKIINERILFDVMRNSQSDICKGYMADSMENWKEEKV